MREIQCNLITLLSASLQSVRSAEFNLVFCELDEIHLLLTCLLCFAPEFSRREITVFYVKILTSQTGNIVF